MAAMRYSAGLQGKTAVVCGSDGAVGYHLAVSLAKQGCKLVLLGRASKLVSVIERMEKDVQAQNEKGASGKKEMGEKMSQFSAHADVKVVELDECGCVGSVDAAVEEAWRAFGCLDIFLHAGLYQGAPTSPLELSEEEWDKTMNSNLKGVWMVTTAVSKRMQRQGRGGSIVFVTSIVGTERCFFPGHAAFGTSVAAVHYLAQVLAMELGKFQIRVNAVAKGLVEADRGINVLGTRARDVVPLRRWMDVSTDLEALVFLYAGDFSKLLTGNISYVDGGLSIVRPRLKALL